MEPLRRKKGGGRPLELRDYIWLRLDDGPESGPDPAAAAAAAAGAPEPLLAPRRVLELAVPEVFLGPPVYRSPQLPAFLSAGDRSYGRGPAPGGAFVDAQDEVGRRPSASDEEVGRKILASLESPLHPAPQPPAPQPPAPQPPAPQLPFSIHVINFLAYSILPPNIFLWYLRSMSLMGRLALMVMQRLLPALEPRPPALPPLGGSKAVGGGGEAAPMELCEELTPVVCEDEDGEIFRLSCEAPGMYRCAITDLVFEVEGEEPGELSYRVVPWDRKLLAQHGRRPAGPLFEVRSSRQKVRRLHLPHCQLRAWGALAVAHLSADGVEFLRPQGASQTHVTVSVTHLSGFGVVKGQGPDAADGAVRALVLLFYTPSLPPPEADSPPSPSLLNVLLLPRNVLLRDVLRFRRSVAPHETYLETSPHCTLRPRRRYVLAARPPHQALLVQPQEADFDCDDYDNYFPTFQVELEAQLTSVQLFVSEHGTSDCVWERRLRLCPTAGRRPAAGVSGVASGASPSVRLKEVRVGFMGGASAPLLESLLNELLDRNVITDAEMEAAARWPARRQRAQELIDMVRKKGDAASATMVHFLCEVDPFLCEHIGLM